MALDAKVLDQSPDKYNITKAGNMNTLTKIKLELHLNTKALKLALSQSNMRQISELKMQRDNLKDMLISELENQLVNNSSKLAA